MSKKNKRKGKRKKKKTRPSGPADVALSRFLEAKNGVLDAARDEIPDWIMGTDETRRGDWWRWLWAELEAARLFVVPVAIMSNIMLQADVVTTETVLRQKWRHLLEPADLDNMLSPERYKELIAEAARKIQPPDPSRWPFPTMWVGFEGGLPLSEPHLLERIHDETKNRYEIVSGVLVGQLYTRDRVGRPVILEAVSFKFNTYGEGLGRGQLWHHAYNENRDGWDNPVDLNAWICPEVIGFFSQFGTYIAEHAPPRSHVRQSYKTFRGAGVPLPVPKPYYTIKLQAKVQQERPPREAPPSGSTWKKTYRTDVRGHDRVRVARGQLPLDPKLAQKYLDRGYRVYAGIPVKPYDAVRLLKRGVAPKKPDEWMALKVTWVKEHMSPADESLRYVPAVRVA